MTRFVRNLIAIVIIVLTASPSYSEDDKPRVVFNDDAQMLGEAPLEGIKDTPSSQDSLRNQVVGRLTWKSPERSPLCRVFLHPVP